MADATITTGTQNGLENAYGAITHPLDASHGDGGSILVNGEDPGDSASFVKALTDANLDDGTAQILRGELDVIEQNMREARAPLQFGKPHLTGQFPIVHITAANGDYKITLTWK